MFVYQPNDDLCQHIRVITMILNCRLKGIKNSSLSSRYLIFICGNRNKSRMIASILGLLQKKPGIFNDQKNTLKIIGECIWEKCCFSPVPCMIDLHIDEITDGEHNRGMSGKSFSLGYSYDILSMRNQLKEPKTLHNLGRKLTWCLKK